MSTYGTYQTLDGRPALRFERRLDHPVDRVWRALTEPDELEQWFPDSVDMELRIGGTVTFTFSDDAMPPMHGRVLALDPPRLLEMTWGDEQLRFELEPCKGGDATLLRFTQLLSRRDAAARDGAGWQVCLEQLDLVLDGGSARAPGNTPTDEWRRHYERYVERGVPSGAPIPTAG